MRGRWLSSWIAWTLITSKMGCSAKLREEEVTEIEVENEELTGEGGLVGDSDELDLKVLKEPNGEDGRLTWEATSCSMTGFSSVLTISSSQLTISFS